MEFGAVILENIFQSWKSYETTRKGKTLDEYADLTPAIIALRRDISAVRIKSTRNMTKYIVPTKKSFQQLGVTRETLLASDYVLIFCDDATHNDFNSSKEILCWWKHSSETQAPMESLRDHEKR